ncbi:MAG: type II toxin-antitoxin system RelE/ParE family toxin [Candidatus Sumerlaeaceae bacterium]
MKVRILQEAREDIIRGQSFYEQQGDGLGDYFVNSLFSDIDSLCLHAGVHVTVYGYHRMVAKRFPFSIYYRIDNNVAYVWRVIDSRREPRWIREQLS